MSRYQLRLLGSFQFTLGEEPATFRSEKERALLAYLAIEGFRPHSRDALAGLLWSDLPEDVAHNNLRVTLHRLRQVVGDLGADLPLLEVSRQAIQLSPTSQLWVDVSSFKELLARADQHAHEKLATCQECMAKYAEAAALYRGEFLQGVYPADSILFSEWAALNREHLHLEALRALYFLAAYHRRRGELNLALSYALQQLGLEPWREEAYCQAMTILALKGERSAALRYYERCRRVLKQELGVEPADETRLLYERILASRKRRRHNFPLQATPFLGRKAELDQMSEYLANPDCRLLTILGPGGIGKSRLAMQVAEAQIYTYLHGAFLVQLAGITMPIDMIRAIAGALELQFHPVGDPQIQLLDYLREKEMLLVLDNFEQLLGSGKPAAVSILEDLLENASNLRLLITSRQRLNLKREWVFVLQGLSLPGDVFDQDLEKYEAVQLFLQSARRIDPTIQPAKEEPVVVRICQLLEGVPLAILLAAAWTRVMSPEQIALEIESNLDFLASSYPDLPERHRSLRATFNHSYELLTSEEQQVLCNLSIFPVSFDRTAAEQVAGATLAMLANLSDRSLIEQIRTGNRGSHPRYRMHELIKQFSHEKFRQDPAEVERSKDRYRRFYMTFLNSRNNKVMGGMASYQAGQEVNSEIENVRLALEQAIAEGNLNELDHSLNILMYYYEIQGLFEEAECVFGEISRVMEKICLTGQDAGEEAGYYLGRAVMYHGWYCMHQARLDQAVELTQKGLALSRHSGDLEGYGLALNSLGVLARAQGKYQQAKGSLQEALKVLSENRYTWSQAGVLSNLGILAQLEGDLYLGEEFFNQSLDLYTRLDDEWGVANCLEKLGNIALLQGNLELANKRILQSIDIRRKLGQRWREANSLTELGEVAYRRQRYDEAKRIYQESLAILRDFGERLSLASTLARYGEVCLVLGDNAQARESLQASLKLAQEIGVDGTATRALLGMAELLVKEGAGEQSLEILFTIVKHSSLEHDDKVKTDNLLTELQAVLPPQVVLAAQAEGEWKSLEDLVKDVLRSDQ